MRAEPSARHSPHVEAKFGHRGQQDAAGVEAQHDLGVGACAPSGSAMSSAGMAGLDASSDARALALALLSKQMLNHLPYHPSRAVQHQHSAMTSQGLESVPSFLQHPFAAFQPGLDVAHALPHLHYFPFSNPSLPLQTPGGVQAQEAAENPTNGECDDDSLGPVVEICGLHRRELGRRISAFNFFVKDTLPQVREEFPGMLHQDCMKRVAEKWQQMTKDEKAKWCFDPPVPKILKGKKKRKTAMGAAGAGGATADAPSTTTRKSERPADMAAGSAMIPNRAEKKPKPTQAAGHLTPALPSLNQLFMSANLQQMAGAEAHMSSGMASLQPNMRHAHAISMISLRSSPATALSAAPAAGGGGGVYSAAAADGAPADTGGATRVSNTATGSASSGIQPEPRHRHVTHDTPAPKVYPKPSNACDRI
jgi:hypothetical protein